MTGPARRARVTTTNMDASARYNLQIVLNSGNAAATGPVFTTNPTGFGTLAITVEVLCRSQPPQTDLYGNRNSITPPAVGTVQYWTAQTFSALTGAQTLQLSRVGNLIRNHILVFRDSTANQPRTTAEASDLPPTLEFDWDAGIRYMSNLATQRQLTFLSYGYNHPLGAVLYPNTLDPDWQAFSEFGDQWMPTVGATKLTLRFTPAASVGLTVLTNDIVPASGQVYAAPALSAGY